MRMTKDQRSRINSKSERPMFEIGQAMLTQAWEAGISVCWGAAATRGFSWGAQQASAHCKDVRAYSSNLDLKRGTDDQRLVRSEPTVFYQRSGPEYSADVKVYQQSLPWKLRIGHKDSCKPEREVGRKLIIYSTPSVPGTSHKFSLFVLRNNPVRKAEFPLSPGGTEAQRGLYTSSRHCRQQSGLGSHGPRALISPRH